MNIKLLRFIDKWAGLPLCFLFTITDKILSFFSFISSKDTDRRAPGKILFIGLAEMGSIVLAYPLIKKARDTYPEAEVFFLTFSRNNPVFGVLDMIPQRNVLSVREESVFLAVLDGLKALFRFRKEKIDTVFDLEFFSRSTSVISYLTGARRRIGFYGYNMDGLYRGGLLTHRIQYNPLLHVSRSFLSLWQAAKSREKSSPDLEERISDEETALPLISPPEDTERIKDRLNLSGITGEDRMILVHPGEGSLSVREWPVENFIFLCRDILADKRNYIVLIGNKGAREKADLICGAVGGKRCLNLTDKTSLTEIFSLFYVSTALVASDCGLVHLASLTPLKKFVLFGPESPKVFGPIDRNSRVIYSALPCSPCLSVFNRRRSSCRNAKCLKMIKPEYLSNLIKDSIRGQK
ncbi:MAG: hypothetical protein DRP85_04325 [Candidatus Makaraimicrobium thalassicum]|nr:MAG: hypothetical protein DRP85_04325 [Candidatus Omnitrophota bacterium]